MLLLLLEGYHLQERYKDSLQSKLIKIIVPPKKEHSVLQTTGNLFLPIEHPPQPSTVKSVTIKPWLSMREQKYPERTKNIEKEINNER